MGKTKLLTALGFTLLASTIATACGSNEPSPGDADPSGDGGATQATDGASPSNPSGPDASPPPPPPPPPPGFYKVGGTVASLRGKGLVLQNNAADDLAVGEPLPVLPDGGVDAGDDGGAEAGAPDAGDADAGGDDAGAPDGGVPPVTFVFPKAIQGGSPYAVTVARQPRYPLQTCVATNAAGTVTGDVTDVAVSCVTDTFAVGGTVSGLDGGDSLVLSLNGGADYTVNANGAFVMPTQVEDGAPYEVVLKTPANGKHCIVTNGAGTIVEAAVSDITVACYLCGNGVTDPGEACDDGNATDGDACTNACTRGTLSLGGSAITNVASALDALGEPFTAAGTNPAAPASGVLVVSNDGGNPLDVPSFQSFLDEGGHILVVGGSATSTYHSSVATFFSLGAGNNWHQSNTCTNDWTKTGAHPITALLPATHEFSNQSTSYHMLHFAGAQPAGTTILGDTCHAGDTSILATRTYASGGTITYMALDLGPYSGGTTSADFVQPFLQGYLAYVRGPKP